MSRTQITSALKDAVRVPASWSNAAWILALFGPIALYALSITMQSQAYNPLRNTVLFNIPFIFATYLSWRHAKIGHDRWSWRLIAVGIGFYTAGNVMYDLYLYAGLPVRIPWWLPDAISLVMPFCMYLAITLFVRARVNMWQPSTAMDGLIIASGGAALLYQTVYAPVLKAGDNMVQSILYTAYPIADLMMIALAVSASFLLKHGLRSGWGVLNIAFLIFAITDTAFLYDAADGIYSTGGFRDLGWMSAGALMGVAALSRWQSRGVEHAEASAVLFWPISTSFIMLAYFAGAVMHGNVQNGANLLGLTCLALTIARVSFTIREGHQMFSMRRESRTDEVTGLNNRRGFDEHLQKSVLMDSPFALLMLDLDGFKQINDGFGHEIGDKVLIEVAHRIESVTPELTISARIGGDEFAVIVPGLDEDGLRKLGDRLMIEIQKPYLFHVTTRPGEEAEAEDHTESINTTVGASMGCSLYPRDGAELELVRFADSAMYQIKKNGGGMLVHEPMGGVQVDINTTQFELFKQLRRALHADADDNKLLVHYQPIAPVDDTQQMVVEALVRWQQGGRLIPPGAFISLAETGGLMQKMTEKVLNQALADLADQRAMGHDLRMSVNLAVSSLLDPTLIDTVKGALSRHSVPAEALKLEITESMIILDPRTAQRTVAALRELGVGVMVDDYGTGYSSIAHLQQLDIDGLKIDRSFVSEVVEHDRVQKIVQSVIDMARAMDIQIVAEGVETHEQLMMLQQMGCDYIQGFFIARPMEISKLSSWLDERAGADHDQLAA